MLHLQTLSICNYTKYIKTYTDAYVSLVQKLNFLLTDVMFEITPSGQPQQENKTQPKAVTDLMDTDRNKFAGQQMN